MDQPVSEGRLASSPSPGLAFRRPWPLRGWSWRPLQVLASFIPMCSEDVEGGNGGRRVGDGGQGRGGVEDRGQPGRQGQPPWRRAKHLAHVISHHPHGSPILWPKDGAGMGGATLLSSPGG